MAEGCLAILEVADQRHTQIRDTTRQVALDWTYDTQFIISLASLKICINLGEATERTFLNCKKISKF